MIERFLLDLIIQLHQLNNGRNSKSWLDKMDRAEKVTIFVKITD
jgi:hypothetical protein